jgi:hypothetical protein
MEANRRIFWAKEGYSNLREEQGKGKYYFSFTTSVLRIWKETLAI